MKGNTTDEALAAQLESEGGGGGTGGIRGVGGNRGHPLGARGGGQRWEQLQGLAGATRLTLAAAQLELGEGGGGQGASAGGGGEAAVWATPSTNAGPCPADCRATVRSGTPWGAARHTAPALEARHAVPCTKLSQLNSRRQRRRGKNTHRTYRTRMTCQNCNSRSGFMAWGSVPRATGPPGHRGSCPHVVRA